MALNMNKLMQNTPEWEKHRKNKIGASDAPIIMQESPWTTPYQLWEKKMDLVCDPKTTPAQQRGHDLEPLAREELEKMTGILFLPRVIFHPTTNYLMASLDAIDPEGLNIAEIKCAGKEDHSLALAGQVPRKYFPQLQHQLEVCQLDLVLYFSFDGSKGVIVKVYRDDKYIKEMLQKEKEFWECMQEFNPPPLTDKDFEKKDDESWKETAQEWRLISNQMKELENREKQLRDSLISMSNNRNAMGHGIKVSTYPRKGSVDYSSIPEIRNIDLELYRKKTSKCWKITSL